MRHDIRANAQNLTLFRDVVAAVEDGREAARHERAVRRYREEREAALAANEAWWIDVGGESGPC